MCYPQLWGQQVPREQGTTLTLDPPRFPETWVTHIWCKRSSRIWRKVSALKYKAAPEVRRAPLTHTPGTPSLGDPSFGQVPTPPNLAPGSGTHRWLWRGAETAGGPSPHPRVSLEEKAGLKAPCRTLPYPPHPRKKLPPILWSAPIPSCPHSTSPGLTEERSDHSPSP
jgi:hypothetical protein